MKADDARAIDFREPQGQLEDDAGNNRPRMRRSTGESYRKPFLSKRRVVAEYRNWSGEWVGAWGGGGPGMGQPARVRDHDATQSRPRADPLQKNVRRHLTQK